MSSEKFKPSQSLGSHLVEINSMPKVKQHCLPERAAVFILTDDDAGAQWCRQIRASSLSALMLRPRHLGPAPHLLHSGLPAHPTLLAGVAFIPLHSLDLKEAAQGKVV